jgi:hypothetical protein
MKLLLLIDGLSFISDLDQATLQSATSIHLLYLSPRSNEKHFLNELKARIPDLPEIKVWDSRQLVDFDVLQSAVLEKTESLGRNLRIHDQPAQKAFEIQGLNRWWSSPLVEGTILKWPLLGNLYALKAVQKLHESKSFDQVLTNRSESDFLLDLKNLAQKLNFRADVIAPATSSFKASFRSVLKWFFNFSSHLILNMILKWLQPKQILAGIKRIHLFYGFYPDQTLIRDHKPHSKIYGTLPKALAAKAGGHSVFFVHFGAREIFRLPKLRQDLSLFWKDPDFYRMFSTHAALSFVDIIKIYLDPSGLYLYSALKRTPGYKTSFIFDGVDLFHTCDRMMKKALYGQECRDDLLQFKALKHFLSNTGFQVADIFHFVEFHSWEAAIVLAARSCDHWVKTIGIQQSAPDPTLLSYYFTQGMFQDPNSRYPMPDLVLCAGDGYRDLLNSYQISPSKAVTVGHLTASPEEPVWDLEKKKSSRTKLGLPVQSKICFIPCSLEADLVEGVFILLKDILPLHPEIHFLVKPHPNTPIEDLIEKYQLQKHSNFEVTQVLVPKILPACDYCISTCTSVSLEALVLKISQVHLDVGELPYRDSLHFEKNLVQDVSTAEQLSVFLKTPQNFQIPGHPEQRFMGSPLEDPLQTALAAIQKISEDASS